MREVLTAARGRSVIEGCGAACPCRVAYREADKSRAIFSSITGARYTVDEVEPGLFAYRYFVDEPRAEEGATSA